MKRVFWPIFIFFAVGVGLYPGMFFLVDMSQGLLGEKPAEVVGSSFWRFAFYQHIIFGGISLLAGWSQFMPRLRNRRLSLHRLLGKVYLTAVLLGGSAGLYLAFYASGGMAGKLGFGMLAILWLGTSAMAYASILRGRCGQAQGVDVSQLCAGIRCGHASVVSPVVRYPLGVGLSFELPCDRLVVLGAEPVVC